MKPYPFASLNHFTVPVAIEKTPPLPAQERAGRRRMRNRYSLDLPLTVAPTVTSRTSRRRIQHQLCAAKNGDRGAAVAGSDGRVPHVRRPSHVQGARLAAERALPGRAQEVR